MSDGRHAFEMRRQNLILRHQALARGFVAKLLPDGLIVLEPCQIRFRRPIRGFVLLMGMLMAFKGFMLAGLGATGYGERLGVLSDGTLYEKVGAIVMAVDPVSQFIADILARLI